ncbi:MAG TPA: ABC transporter permease [Spirochaetota bacterium]|nr:ABC transporter permease [Spirochaetota bacterium]
MNIKNAIITAIRSLKRNKLRSLLTSIGIVIGVSSVILMIGLGSSARVEVKDKVANFGENGISIEVKPNGKKITYNDLAAVKNEIYEIDRISPICYIPEKNGLIRYRNNVSHAKMWGVSNDYLSIKGRSVINGRSFTEEDVDSFAKVVIIGLTVKETLFGNRDPIGEQMLLNGVPLQVIGVLNRAGMAFSGNDFDNEIMVPHTTANIRFFGRRNIYTEMLLSTKEETMLPNAETKLIKYLRTVHNLREGAEDDFWIKTSKEKLKMTEDITRALSFLLAGIASISLFVGGVGIMNIMLVSVTERTREIGIRMAIGAKRRDILFQFLIEAITLTSVGGAIGIMLGLLIYLIIVIVLKWLFIFSLISVLLSFIFSTAVGVFFGYYPARKASNLKPIDALKFE